MKKILLTCVCCACCFLLSAQNYEYVDLGLPSGTLWASCNIGAVKSNELGTFFSWGECVGNKSAYNETSYKFFKSGKCVKYCTNPEYGEVDGKLILDPEDDAATCILGDDWSMPTVEQVEELVRCCTVQEVKIKKVKGMLFTGTNHNSIFLPYGGVRFKNEHLFRNENGSYWLKEISENVPDIAAFFNVKKLEVRYHDRFNGYLIRPVKKQQ